MSGKFEQEAINANDDIINIDRVKDEQPKTPNSGSGEEPIIQKIGPDGDDLNEGNKLSYWLKSDAIARQITNGINVNELTQETEPNEELVMQLVANGLQMAFQNLQNEKEPGDIFERELLTVEDRLNLSILLLEAYQSQVIDKQLIHQNLNPDTIYFDLEQKTVNIKGFEHSLNVEKNTKDNQKNYTYALNRFSAPEQFAKEKASVQSEIFSLGRVLSLVWNINEDNFNQYDNKITSENLILKRMFNFIPGLTKQNALLIKEILEEMLVANPLQRLSIKEAIDRFKQIEIIPKKQIDNTLAKFDELNKQVVRLQNRGDKEAATALSKLHSFLDENLNKLKNMDIKTFATPQSKTILEACYREIETTQKQVLDKHRNLNYVFVNVALAIASLCSVIGLIVYVPAIIINYQQTNKLGFFRQTYSSKLADAVKMELPLEPQRDDQGYVNFPQSLP